MAAVSKIENGVVELRTDVGRLYVCPSGWQRVYLRWTFRNFHCLPQQILNRRQQRLIERLWRNALLTPTERVPASAVIGVVENMRVLGLPSTADRAEVKTAKPATHEATLAVLRGTAEAAAEFRAPAVEPRAPARLVSQITDDVAAGPAARQAEPAIPPDANVEPGGAPFPKRNVLAVPLLGASAATVLLLGFWLAPLWRAPQLPIAPPLPPAPPLAAKLKPAAPAVAAQPAAGSAPRREARSVAGQHPARPATSAARNTPAPAAALADAAGLPQIAERPAQVQTLPSRRAHV